MQEATCVSKKYSLLRGFSVYTSGSSLKNKNIVLPLSSSAFTISLRKRKKP